MTTATHATGNLDFKLVATHLKHVHKEHSLMVQRVEDGVLISTPFMMVKVPAYADIPFVRFDAKWERATFSAKEFEAREGGSDCQQLWERIITRGGVERLEMTDWLREVTSGVRNKTGQHRTGQLARKLVTEKERTVLIDKGLCDMLSPDGDELENFLFEQADPGQAVRVACKYGYVAILMPMSMNR